MKHLVDRAPSRETFDELRSNSILHENQLAGGNSIAALFSHDVSY